MDWFWLLKGSVECVALGAVILYAYFFLMGVMHHIASREEDTKKLNQCLSQIRDSVKELERIQENQGRTIAQIAKQILPQIEDDDWPTGGPLEFRTEATIGESEDDSSILERYMSAANQHSPDANSMKQER